MTGGTVRFGFDPHDAEWETGDGFRTVSTLDDDWCDVCQSEIDFSVGGPDGTCDCEEAPC